MPDHSVPSQSANRLPENSFPPPTLHQPHGHVRQHFTNPHVAGNDQQDIHQEGVPQPIGAPHGPHYNAAHYHPPPPPYPEDPYMPMHWDVGAAQGAQAYGLAPGVQENHGGHFGYGAQFFVADPPEAFPGVWPHPAPPVNMPPVNGLRNLAGHYLNNPGTRVNMVWIEPGPGGRFNVWIALELADIF